jgi:hypothetical protein
VGGEVIYSLLFSVFSETELSLSVYQHIYSQTSNFNVVLFLLIAPCSPYMNRRFDGSITSIFKVKKIRRARNQRAPGDTLIFDSEIEVIRSFETSIHIRTTLCYNPEDGNIKNYRCENLISYNFQFHRLSFSRVVSTDPGRPSESVCRETTNWNESCVTPVAMVDWAEGRDIPISGCMLYCVLAV